VLILIFHYYYLQSNTTYTETELVHGLKQYNNNAYTHLYQHYKGAIFTIIKQVIADDAIAEDVLQEVFVNVWNNIEKYDASKGRLFTWLLNVARNMAISKTRSKNFKSFEKNDAIENYVDYLESKDSEQLNINKIGLRKEVHNLKNDYKNVIELAYFNGFTHEEIAKHLEIPVGTVKTRLRNAVIELRKQFV
jgi:RNA polymerase sigma-70 factor (ECF subfamily)